MPDSINESAQAFIDKWRGVTASELSTSQSFLLDLCRLLQVPVPHATAQEDYLFERPVTFRHGDGSSSAGRIDLYRRGAFVLESKKLHRAAEATRVDEALLRARSQAENYARALPATEGRPPFLIVVDVGRRIELYAEFSRSGATYTPFPDPRSHRIELADLAKPEVRERLRRIWLEPLSLDPSRESARVTRDIAQKLAELAKSLEASGHAPEQVAQFLMRCLFTMFAEDVRLLPEDGFRQLLVRHADEPDVAMRMLRVLWQDMDRGGFSAVLAGDVLQFNGKLFKHAETLPLTKVQLALLIEAARSDWQHVEPAIFGTLLERALSPEERHRLGAHYTPRAYVERLVLPTVIEPLRAEWSDAQAAALTLATEGKADDAIDELRRFHGRLCAVRVLDPACGSGNFLYVTLEHLKRLEGEVLNALDELGWRQGGLAIEGERAEATAAETVDPHNLLGIELNPRAATIAEVVLWIGYLQWHFRTRGNVNPPQPVVRDFRNIENRDAVLAYDKVEYARGEDGRPVTRWDGRTMKVSPVTGEEIPDERAVVPLERYVNPRKAEWPEADFILGNPPFIGKRNMRIALGDGYVDTLRSTWDEVPDSADLVMYWWQLASRLVRDGKVERFGFITTNSISQTFNRRVLESAMGDSVAPLSLAFAIPDHPWVDAADGAAVRIAMTVGTTATPIGTLSEVVEEREAEDEVAVKLNKRRGIIHPDLKIGANVSSAVALNANLELSNIGVIPLGKGFIIEAHDAQELSSGLLPEIRARIIREYRNGRDLTDTPRGVFAIDTYRYSEQQLREIAPRVWQWLHDRVKPERDQNPRRGRRENWWRYGEDHPRARNAIHGLPRYIATIYTSKYRTFQFLDAAVLPDQTLLVIGLDDALNLGVLSSSPHVTWAMAAGGRLGVGNDPRYNKSRCFEAFPFPLPVDKQADCIRKLAEQLDAHRKYQQATHPDISLTSVYNVLEKLRASEPLTPRERTIHQQGLVSVLRQLHDGLDVAVLDAYGWSDLLPLLRAAHGNESPAEGQTREGAKRAFDEEVLKRLVALNAERAAEEARGRIRWLRPEFQVQRLQPQQAEIATEHDVEQEPGESMPAAAAKAKRREWPKNPLDQVRAVAEVIAASPTPLSADDITALFSSRGPWKKRVPPLLAILVALGRANERDGRFLARG